MACNIKSGNLMLYSDSVLKQSIILCLKKKKKKSLSYPYTITSISKKCSSKFWFTLPKQACKTSFMQLYR